RAVGRRVRHHRRRRHEAARPPAAPWRDAAARRLRAQGAALRPAPHRHDAPHGAARDRAAGRPAARGRMNFREFVERRFVGSIFAFVAGTLLSLSFAPIDFWPLAFLAPAALIWLWE